MELKGKRALVVGLAASGSAAARLLVREGAEVRVNDLKPLESVTEFWKPLSGLGIKGVFGGHPAELFAWADLIVVSPGVPRSLPGLVQAQRASKEILSEMEFAARFVTAPILAVGGTNGKTTTTTLLGQMMAAGLAADQVWVGGNIGTPLSELALAQKAVRAVVVEVSSFQMEFAHRFRPRVGIMLNVSPDHLDRYRDLDDYAATKSRMFASQTAEDFALLNADDPICAAMARSTAAQVRWFGLSSPRRPGIWRQGPELWWDGPPAEGVRLSLNRWKPAGKHNVLNAMAAAAAALCFGVAPDKIQETLDHFPGLPHRLEWVAEVNGVSFYNDSKATNLDAVRVAVQSFDRPIILLVGGQAKGCHFQSLQPELKHRVKLVVAYGESREQMAAELAQPDAYQILTRETLAAAFHTALQAAKPGEVVLLSPACASFDQFRNYQDRGEQFRKLVEAQR